MPEMPDRTLQDTRHLWCRAVHRIICPIPMILEIIGKEGFTLDRAGGNLESLQVECCYLVVYKLRSQQCYTPKQGLLDQLQDPMTYQTCIEQSRVLECEHET